MLYHLRQEIENFDAIAMRDLVDGKRGYEVGVGYEDADRSYENP